MTLAVWQPSDIVVELRKDWAVIDALMHGTRAMRLAGESLLPKWPNEEVAAYNARLATATLFPAYQRTCSVMSGKPFSKPLTLRDADARIEAMADDIDMQGNNLHVFAANLFRQGIAYGLCGILVEFPRATDAAPRTMAEFQAAGLRPYFLPVRHSQILGWRTEPANGRSVLTQLRILEYVDRDDGEYDIESIARVRVYTPGGFQLWEATSRNASGSSWQLIDEGATTLPFIPFVPVYGRYESFMIGRPPLLDLAYQNVKHWQSQSDQDTILHVSRVPILAMIGAEDDTQLTVGASSAVKLPPGADLKFVEHSGAAIEAGAKSLRDLEQQMIQAGAELLVKTEGARSATEAAGDLEGNKSDLQRIAENFEDALDMALWIAGRYINVERTGSVELFDDYGAASLSDASAQIVVGLQQTGLLSKPTTLEELKRRGVLSSDVDPERELEAVEAEGPAMGAIGQVDESPQ